MWNLTGWTAKMVISGSAGSSSQNWSNLLWMMGKFALVVIISCAWTDRGRGLLGGSSVCV